MVFCNNLIGEKMVNLKSHNPYFNRWFSAMYINKLDELAEEQVTILILIDGFLQWELLVSKNNSKKVTILILIDGFLQCTDIRVQYLVLKVTILILIDGFLQYIMTCLIVWISGVTILILIDGFLQLSVSEATLIGNLSQSLF